MDTSLEFVAYVEAFRRVSPIKAIGWLLVVVMAAIVVVDALLSGRWAQLVAFPVFVFAIGKVRAETASRTQIRTIAHTTVSDGCLRVLLPATRLIQKRYVDQCYICRIDAVEEAFFDGDDAFHLRARRLESYAMEGDDVIDHTTKEYAEVTLRLDGDERQKLTRFLGANGLPLPA